MYRRIFNLASVTVGTVLASGALIGQVTASANTAQPALKTVTSGYLTVAVAGDMPMTSVQDGKLIGADGDLLNLVAQKLHLKVKPIVISWPGPIQAVQAGRADVAIGDIWWNADRSKAMLMTDPAYYVNNMILEKSGTKSMTSLRSLKGMTLGTGVGSYPLVDLEKLQKAGGIKSVVTYSVDNSIVQDIRNGRIDGAFIDPPTGAYVVKQHPEFGLKLVTLVVHNKAYPSLSSGGEACWAVYKNEAALYDAINKQVDGLWKSSTNKSVLSKYGMDSEGWYTPNGNVRKGVDRSASWQLPQLH